MTKNRLEAFSDGVIVRTPASHPQNQCTTNFP
jgi:hypothetical protein